MRLKFDPLPNNMSRLLKSAVKVYGKGGFARSERREFKSPLTFAYNQTAMF